MASGKNIYSKKNIEKKRDLQQSTKSSKGDSDKTSSVASTARPPVPRNCK